MSRTVKYLFASLVLFAFVKSVFAWDGQVSSVIDGDTITILKGKESITVRLYGIDCPEKGQDFGTKATQFVFHFAQNKKVSVEEVEKDKYGRTVAKVYFTDGSCLSEVLIQEGLAWVYDEYCTAPECVKWRELQAKAKENLDGLWAMNSPIPPWQYRNNSPVPETSQNVKKPAPIKPKEAKQPSDNITVYATRTGSKYHRAGCRYLSKSSIPMSLSDAKARGLTPCSVCKPPQ